MYLHPLLLTTCSKPSQLMWAMNIPQQVWCWVNQQHEVIGKVSHSWLAVLVLSPSLTSTSNLHEVLFLSLLCNSLKKLVTPSAKPRKGLLWLGLAWRYIPPTCSCLEHTKAQKLGSDPSLYASYITFLLVMPLGGVRGWSELVSSVPGLAIGAA